MLRKLTTSALLGLCAAAMPALAQEEVAPSILEGTEVQAPDMINLLHQREWVRLDNDGIVKGTLLTLEQDGTKVGRVGAKVVVSKDGKALFETVSDVGGEFSIEGLKPGTYALQSRGDLTFAAYALHVLPSNTKHLTTDLEVLACVIPEAKATELIAMDAAPADWEGVQDVYYRHHEKDPIANDRKFNNSPQIVLRDGDLVGRVSRPGWTYGEQDLTGTVAQIVRDGEVLRKAAVSKDGYYIVKDLEPGVYDLFVSGDDGFAVLAFEAVAAKEPVAVNGMAPRFVSAQIGMASDCLCCELIHQPEITACSTCQEVIVEEIVAIEGCGCEVDACGCGAPSPMMGGGFAGGGGFYGGGGGFGGGGGGFGGGGGLGGLGGLLGVAGLAVGVAALADDDDGFNIPPASPL